MTPPTVGRIVWFWPTDTDPLAKFGRNEGEPLAAMIVCVWSDDLVNLTVFSGDGTTHGRSSIHLAQDPAERPTPGDYAFCEWPQRVESPTPSSN